MGDSRNDDRLETPSPDFSIDEARDIAEHLYGLTLNRERILAGGTFAMMVLQA